MLGVAPMSADLQNGYKLLQTLHQYGRTLVSLAQHPTKHGGQRVVIKRTELVGASAESRRLAIQEAQLLSHLRHPNVVKCLDTWEAAESIFIVMEWLQLGDLAGFADGRLPLNCILDIAIQLLLALKHLHSIGILHRDVKTKNILVSPLMPGSRSLRVKLADFGVARLVLKPGSMAKTTIGTPFYSSPEIFSGTNLILSYFFISEGAPYDSKSDIWSLGCVIYELVVGKRPFESSNFKDLSRKVLQSGYEPLPKSPPYGLRELVDSMLQASPLLRPSASDLLEHPYIQEHCARFYAQLKAISVKQYPSEFMQRLGPLRERLGLRGAVEAMLLLMCPGRLGELDRAQSEPDLLELAYQVWATGEKPVSSLASTLDASIDELTMTMQQLQAPNHHQKDDQHRLRRAIAQAVSWEEFEMIHEVMSSFAGAPQDQIMRYLEKRLGSARHAQLQRDNLYSLINDLIKHESQ